MLCIRITSELFISANNDVFQSLPTKCIDYHYHPRVFVTFIIPPFAYRMDASIFIIVA